jgi:hypothetical protein
MQDKITRSLKPFQQFLYSRFRHSKHEAALPSEVIPEPPPLITYTQGRSRSIYTALHYCANNDCEYYGWLARGNICSNGHPNSSIWL